MRLTLILAACIATSALADNPGFVITETDPQGWVITDNQPPAADNSMSPKGRPYRQRPVVLTSWSACPTGYIFKFSNGGVVEETFVDYMRRTGKVPPDARHTCETGHCGTFSRSVTLPAAGCTCGCDADSCNCYHSRNANKPLAQQRLHTR